MKIKMFLLLLPVFLAPILDAKNPCQLRFEKTYSGGYRLEQQSDSLRDLLNAPKTPSGQVKQYALPSFAYPTNTSKIQGKVGNTFGLSFLIHSKCQADIPFRIKWIYPKPLLKTDGKALSYAEFSAKYPVNTPYLLSYQIELPSEIIPGTWKLEVFYENRKVYSEEYQMMDE